MLRTDHMMAVFLCAGGKNRVCSVSHRLGSFGRIDILPDTMVGGWIIRMSNAQRFTQGLKPLGFEERRGLGTRFGKSGFGIRRGGYTSKPTYHFVGKYPRQGSNLQPSASEADALSN